MADAKNQAMVAELIAGLNGDDTNQAEEAQATLERYGAAVLAPLMDAAPQFGRVGQLCAIELFQKISDPRAGSVLMPMLRSDHDTVREWAAQALGDLGVREAAPELQAAYERAERSNTPPSAVAGCRSTCLRSSNRSQLLGRSFSRSRTGNAGATLARGSRRRVGSSIGRCRGIAS
jgi:hypothetical protein